MNRMLCDPVRDILKSPFKSLNDHILLHTPNREISTLSYTFSLERNPFCVEPPRMDHYTEYPRPRTCELYLLRSDFLLFTDLLFTCFAIPSVSTISSYLKMRQKEICHQKKILSLIQFEKHWTATNGMLRVLFSVFTHRHDSGTFPVWS